MKFLLLACSLAMAVQLQFLDKPLHIDDYLFLRIARNMLDFPLAPFMGPDFFTGAVRDLFIHNNPPLFPGILAGILFFVGEDLFFLHLGLLPFTCLAIVAFWGVARHFCENPAIPTLSWAVSLPLLLSGQHLMSDAPAVALMLAGLWCILESKKRPLLWIPAALFLAASLLCKYSMAFFLLYALLLARVHRMTRTRLMAFLFLSSLPFWIWCLHNILTHGSVHMMASGRQGDDSPLGLDWTAWWWVRQKMIYALPALGQTGAPWLLVVFLFRQIRPRWIPLLSVGLAVMLCTQLPNYDFFQLVQFGLWSAFGIFVLLAPLVVHRHQAWLLWGWLYAFLAATVVVMPFGSIRFLLPCFPPMLLLLHQLAEHLELSKLRLYLGCCFSLIFTILSCQADYSYAKLYPGLAEQAVAEANKQEAELWFTAEGALRPQLEARGAKYLTARSSALKEGSLVAMAVNCHHYALSPKLTARLEEWAVLDATHSLPLRIESSEAKAGFYAHPNGYLPVAFSKVMAESLYLFKVVQANPFAQYFIEHREKIPVQGEIQENVHQFERGFWLSFMAHPPSVARFTIPLPVSASIRFGFGLREEVSGPSYGDGVTFRIRALDLDAGQEQIVYERYIDPKNIAEDRIIHQAEVHLDNAEDARVALQFENDCGPVQDCRYDWALWTMPELIPQSEKE